MNFKYQLIKYKKTGDFIRDTIGGGETLIEEIIYDSIGGVIKKNKEFIFKIKAKRNDDDSKKRMFAWLKNEHPELLL